MARLFGPQSARLRKLFILADAHLPIGAVNASGNQELSEAKACRPVETGAMAA
jgi:hypothetical protein